MAEYKDLTEILKVTENYKSELGRLKADVFVKSGIETVEDLIKNVVPTADVVERSKIDNAIAEIETLLKGNDLGIKTMYYIEQTLEILKRNIGE